VKRFDIITEADARTLARGEIVMLARGGHVTPLARDTLRALGVVVQEEDVATADEAALAPAHPIRTLAIASDHTGIALRRNLTAWLRSRGLAVQDLGTDGPGSVDYPDTAGAVARAVAAREADAGIVIDAFGTGSAIAANKVAGVRAAMVTTEALARSAREHNGVNVLALGASLLRDEAAREIVVAWLETRMREPRYIRRLAKVARLERGR
jgi:ribose 5-phosphate isomerase B